MKNKAKVPMSAITTARRNTGGFIVDLALQHLERSIGRVSKDPGLFSVWVI
jgi:hypothetical protein